MRSLRCRLMIVLQRIELDSKLSKFVGGRPIRIVGLALLRSLDAQTKLIPYYSLRMAVQLSVVSWIPYVDTSCSSFRF